MTNGLTSGRFRGHETIANSLFAGLPAIIIGVLSCSAVLAQDPDDFNYLPAVPTADAHEGLMLDVAMAGSRVVAVGERGYAVYSDDDGITWSQGTVPVSQTLTAVTFASDKVGWAVGHEGIILRTDDGGESWQLQFNGYEAAKRELVLAEQRIEKATAELEAARSAESADVEDLEYALEDAQIALESIQIAIDEGPSNPFLDVWFADERTGVAVGSYGMIFRTTDGGENWQAWSDRISNPDGFHYYSLGRGANGTLFLVGEQGLLYRSRNQGQDWERLETPYQGSLFGVVTGGSGGGSYALIFGLRGNIFRTSDDGDSWTPVTSGTELSLFGGTVANDGAVLIVGNSGIVLRSEDGGMNFSGHTRSDRLPHSSVVENGGGNLVLAGRGGAEVVGSDGTDVKGG